MVQGEEKRLFSFQLPLHAFQNQQKRDAQQKCRELERGKAERRQGSVQTGGAVRDGIKRS